ncbi:hypothetical protein MO867_00510 [Microbulbifer sp. OS29]|uniref:Uncharacterized protein n=1 Tax=Microbulbifer okhotskensis TaxID=2926617 RepID=A0A9X2J5V0_9GAMM|nr:hypothetical protein [Microbulbifer okhotskensis]MCO1332806.1 hypothetical protein [Microbulbifer okhotskensis]
MSKISLLFVVLCASGWSAVQAAESPLWGEIAGLLSAEQIYTNSGRTYTSQNRAREWIRLFVNRGDQVRKGQIIAEHRNIKGKVVLEYIANRSGRILLNSRSAIDSVESILEILTVEEEKYCEYENCVLTGNR